MTEKEIYELVSDNGPNRIVVDDQGTAMSLRHARDKLRRLIPYDVVFVRDDGWALGASYEFENVAYLLWRREWIGEVRRYVHGKTSRWFAKSYGRQG